MRCFTLAFALAALAALGAASTDLSPRADAELSLRRMHRRASSSCKITSRTVRLDRAAVHRLEVDLRRRGRSASSLSAHAILRSPADCACLRAQTSLSTRRLTCATEPRRLDGAIGPGAGLRGQAGLAQASSIPQAPTRQAPLGRQEVGEAAGGQEAVRRRIVELRRRRPRGPLCGCVPGSAGVRRPATAVLRRCAERCGRCAGNFGAAGAARRSCDELAHLRSPGIASWYDSSSKRDSTNGHSW